MLQPINFLVDTCQSTFFLGRIITNNSIISHELVKGYRRKGLEWSFALGRIEFLSMLKLDLQKAYDS